MKAWITNVGPNVAIQLESENSAEANVIRQLSDGVKEAGCWIQSSPNAAGLTIQSSVPQKERRSGTDRRNWARFFR